MNLKYWFRLPVPESIHFNIPAFSGILIGLLFHLLNELQFSLVDDQTSDVVLLKTQWRSAVFDHESLDTHHVNMT